MRGFVQCLSHFFVRKLRKCEIVIAEGLEARRLTEAYHLIGFLSEFSHGLWRRDRQSHDIAVAVRPSVDSIARIYGASAKVAEIPPGPPVLSTLVAEVYAADDASRLEAAKAVKTVFEQTPGVVDVDWTVEAPQQKRTFRVDRVRAAESGASVE